MRTALAWHRRSWAGGLQLRGVPPYTCRAPRVKKGSARAVGGRLVGAAAVGCALERLSHGLADGCGRRGGRSARLRSRAGVAPWRRSTRGGGALLQATRRSSWRLACRTAPTTFWARSPEPCLLAARASGARSAAPCTSASRWDPAARCQNTSRPSHPGPPTGPDWPLARVHASNRKRAQMDVGVVEGREGRLFSRGTP